MLAPLALLDQLRVRLDECIPGLPLGHGEGLVSLVLELPLVPMLPPEIPGHRFGLVHGHSGELRAGYGVAAQWQAQGASRLTDLRCQASRLATNWLHWDPDETGFTGFGLIGAAADPDPSTDGEDCPAHDLPNALLWIPSLALVRRGGQAALILSAGLPANRVQLRERWMRRLAQLVSALNTAPPQPRTPAQLRTSGRKPEFPDWRRLVDGILGEIAQGTLDKAVLCRRIGLRGPRPFDLIRLQAALTWLFPTCQVIRIARGDANFIAATPERLLRVRGNRVEVDAIAGTAARSASAAQDSALALGLRHSTKDLREHALVVETLGSTLSACCAEVQIPPVPQLLQLHNAQHLWSPIRAQLTAATDLLDLADRLHPTPATNGTPRQAARDWLRQHEPLARGWYTGFAGILEPDLSGDLWVLLRYAEVRGQDARLYAGAGIVEGSDPLAEWREAGHKLSAMATALRFA